MTTERPTTFALELAGCRDAEDYFRLLGVDHDPQVLDVGRLHILRLFGRELQQLGQLGQLADQDLLAVYRGALERAYQSLMDGGPLDHRVFRVLRDHAPSGFVPVSTIEIEPVRTAGGQDV